MNVIIVNPQAGNGRGKKVYIRLKKLPQYKQLKPVCYYTSYQGHAEEIAAKLEANHVQSLIVIGGDGTLHEVINGLKNKDIPISFIPGGSGNDFARGCSLPKRAEVILKNCLKNKVKNYWLGEYILPNTTSRQFINCIGFGFDAVVTKRANQYKEVFNKLKLGTIVYTLALLKELVYFQPLTVTITTEKGTKTFTRCFLMTVNNQPFFGGGMKIHPTALNNGEDISIMIIDSISKWKVLMLFMTVFKGKHLGFKEVTTLKAKQIKIVSETLLPFQVDGEIGTTMNCSIAKKPLPLKVKGA